MTVTIATHNGSYHLDDLFACAVLGLIFDEQGISYSIIRTRDPQLIASADYVVDVGDIYDPAAKRFDHHQSGGAGVRASGIPYASIGLVWKEFGEHLAGSKEIAEKFDSRILQAIDADDNGVELYKLINEDVELFNAHRIFYAFRPTWKEQPQDFDTPFLDLIPFVKKFILRQLSVLKDKQEAGLLVEQAYQNSIDKRLIVLDGPYPFSDVLDTKADTLFVVGPRSASSDWGAHAIRETEGKYKNRKDFPLAWAGLRNEELQKVSGVPDATFCHRGLFMAVAKSREGAIALAQRALDQ